MSATVLPASPSSPVPTLRARAGGKASADADRRMDMEMGSFRPASPRVPLMEQAEVLKVAVSFKWRVFFKQIFYQMFFPLSLPFVIAIDGSDFAYNLNFLGANPTTLLFQWFTMLWLGVGNAVAIWRLTVAPAETSVLLSQVLHADVLFLFQKLVCAIKYGFMPLTELEKRKKQSLPDDDLLSEQLITGWLAPKSTLEGQLLSSALTRLGYFDSSPPWFYVSPSRAERELPGLLTHQPASKTRLKNAHVFVSEDCALDVEDVSAAEEEERAGADAAAADAAAADAAAADAAAADAAAAGRDGLVRVSLLQLASFLLKSASPNVAVAQNLGRTVAFLHVLPAWISGLIPFGSNAADVFVSVTLLVHQLLWSSILFTFIVVGTIDLQRRLKLLRVLNRRCVMRSRAARESTNYYGHGQTATPGFISLRSPHNARAWLTCRRLLLSYGERFVRRLDTYATLAFVAIILVVAFNILRMVTQPQLQVTGILLSSTSDVVCGIALLVRTGTFGILLNRMHDEDCALVLGEQIDLRRDAMLPKSDEASTLHHADTVLEGVLSSLRHDDQLRPVRVFGLRATAGVLRTVIGVGLSGSITTLRLLGFF